MSFSVYVALTNPGQFFACCGLAELAHRLDPASMSAFRDGRFHLEGTPTLPLLVETFAAAPMTPLDAEEPTSSPIALGQPFEIRLDWWLDSLSGGRPLKVWAGTMQSGRIARAMAAAIRHAAFHADTLFDVGLIVRDPDDPRKKVEPFYFDARRTSNAHSRDVGFSPNDLDLTTTAFPAVEALCLVGLQRFRPQQVGRHHFQYRAWTTLLTTTVAAAVVPGALTSVPSHTYRFENWFRTGQKKHKSFRAAVPISQEETE